MKNTVYFATTNPGKIASAAKHISKVSISPVPLSLIEPRGDSVEEIAKVKAQQAHDIIQRPCIALDAGFFVEELNGFPRAYPKFIVETIGIQGLLKLLEGIENRRAFFEECLVYCDYEGIKLFRGTSPGTISTEIRGESNPKEWSDLWRIFIPDNCDKTLAEMTDHERATRDDKRTSPFVEFNQHLADDKGFRERVRRMNSI